jgi:hypothetical protein
MAYVNQQRFPLLKSRVLKEATESRLKNLSTKEHSIYGCFWCGEEGCKKLVLPPLRSDHIAPVERS